MRAPDFARGPIRIWRISNTAARTPDHAATLAAWAINGPFHPAWSWWLLSVVHLRDIAGVPPAHRQYPGAEYELMIVGLNPDRPFDIDEAESTGDWGDPKVPKFLTPLDLQYQFHGLTDDHARSVGESAIQAILAGYLSPDSDFRQAWILALDATVTHWLAGVHGGRYA